MTSKILKPRVGGGASVVSFKKICRKNTTSSQRLNQYVIAQLRFFEMQKAVAVNQENPTYANTSNAIRAGGAFNAAFSLVCVGGA